MNRGLLIIVITCIVKIVVGKQLRSKIPTDDMPVHVDAVTCDMSECEPMCLCQKILWSIDYRHPTSLGPGDQHCTHWRKSSSLPDSDECTSACSMLVQHVEAAAGRDPHVCLRAVKEVMEIAKKSEGGHGGKKERTWTQYGDQAYNKGRLDV